MTKIKDIVLLWHATQMGNMKICRDKQFEFSDMMWKLYEEQQNKKGETNNG